MALRATTFLDALTYGFEWLRLIPELSLQEGVVGAGDFKVTAAAAGGMRVDVAAGLALVKGDSGTPGTGLSQGLYAQVNDASVANAVTLTAAHATLPRLDQIVLQINDSTDLGSAGNVPALAFVTGVATAGATLDNRNGATALPNNALRLADVLVPAASAAVTAGNVRDRRPWARGARCLVQRVANAAAGFDYSTASTTLVDIDATNLTQRVELSGAPCEIELVGAQFVNLNGFNYVGLGLWRDGSQIFTASDTTAGASIGASFAIKWLLMGHAAASALFSPRYSAPTGGSATIRANTSGGFSTALVFAIRELIGQSANNN